MKIGPLEPKVPVTPLAGERAGAAPAPKAAGPAGSEPGVQVALSARALGVDAAGAEFDADKVQRVAQAIRDGRYTIDAAAIADRLIANARELLERTAR
jgi:negative regulator of flagellin synthesis FlgM